MCLEKACATAGGCFKYHCQISLNVQEVMKDPSADKVVEVLKLWSAALTKQPPTHRKESILGYYADAAVAMTRNVSDSAGAKQQMKLKGAAGAFIDGL